MYSIEPRLEHACAFLRESLPREIALSLLRARRFPRNLGFTYQLDTVVDLKHSWEQAWRFRFRLRRRPRIWSVFDSILCKHRSSKKFQSNVHPSQAWDRSTASPNCFHFTAITMTLDKGTIDFSDKIWNPDWPYVRKSMKVRIDWQSSTTSKGVAIIADFCIYYRWP